MFRCLGVQVFSRCVQVFRCVQVCRCLECSGCLGCLKGDQGGGPNGQNFGWGKNSTFRASFSTKKVFLTAEKVGSVG